MIRKKIARSKKYLYLYGKNDLERVNDIDVKDIKNVSSKRYGYFSYQNIIYAGSFSSLS